MREILPAQERNFQLLREAYQIGEIKITDVFVGQREFVESREAYLDAVATLNAATAELYRATSQQPWGAEECADTPFTSLTGALVVLVLGGVMAACSSEQSGEPGAKAKAAPVSSTPAGKADSPQPAAKPDSPGGTEHTHAEGEAAHAHEDTAGPVVALTAIERENIGLKTARAEMRPFEDVRRLPGVMKPVPDRVAVVTSRTAGKVVDIHAALGQRVEKGEDLIEVQSVEVEKLQLELLQAEARARVESPEARDRSDPGAEQAAPGPGGRGPKPAAGRQGDRGPEGPHRRGEPAPDRAERDRGPRAPDRAGPHQLACGGGGADPAARSARAPGRRHRADAARAGRHRPPHPGADQRDRRGAPRRAGPGGGADHDAAEAGRHIGPDRRGIGARGPPA